MSVWNGKPIQALNQHLPTVVLKTSASKRIQVHVTLVGSRSNTWKKFQQNYFLVVLDAYAFRVTWLVKTSVQSYLRFHHQTYRVQDQVLSVVTYLVILVAFAGYVGNNIQNNDQVSSDKFYDLVFSFSVSLSRVLSLSLSLFFLKVFILSSPPFLKSLSFFSCSFLFCRSLMIQITWTS